MSEVITNMIGQEIRANSPYAFRSKQWARITGAHMWNPRLGQEPRMVWDVEFPDGAVDMWPVHDKAADYEFRERSIAVEKIGHEMRLVNPNEYRGGEWGTVVAIREGDGPTDRPILSYEVEWEDGDRYLFPVNASATRYEFRETA